jgi:uncharacterized phage protein (TIGR02218 family)
MNRFPAPLAAHLGEQVTTLCHCWRVRRKDGVVLGFTDHDAGVVADGTAFQPRSGFAASEARQTLGLASDAADVEGALSSDDIRADDIAAGRFDAAEVETLVVNWRDPAQFAVLRTATVGKITRGDNRFVAELQGLGQALEARQGRTLRRSCDAELGDRRCGFALTAPGYRAAGRVAAVGADGTLTVAGVAGYPPGWFSDGVLTVTDGADAGRSARIALVLAEAGQIVLSLDPSGGVAPAAGSAVTVTAGCDKAFSTCRTKFANTFNFRGFPHLPGNDAGYAYVTEGGVFDGAPLVP